MPIRPPQTITRTACPVNKTQIAEFYARLAATNPAPTTELVYAPPFQ